MACLNCQDGSKPIAHRVHGSSGLDGRHGTLLFSGLLCCLPEVTGKNEEVLIVGTRSAVYRHQR